MSQHEGEASRPEDQLVERPKLSVLAELDAKGSWKQFDSAVLAFAGDSCLHLAFVQRNFSISRSGQQCAC